MSALERIGNKIIDLWLWDIEVLSDPWMYYPLFIPALLFMIFVVIKWAIILCPVWIVPNMIAKGYGEGRSKQKFKLKTPESESDDSTIS